MKRRELLRHLAEHGCELIREGRKHGVFYNPSNSKISTVPRHRDVNEFLARKIFKDLGIPEPAK